MKKKFSMMEAPTPTLLIGLAIGMGMAVHEFFFLVALGLVLASAVKWSVQKVDEYGQDFRVSYRHERA